MIGEDHPLDDDFLDELPIEAYCVRCKMKVEMETPTPVWTRRGTPGTRGECPHCGTTIFRMGKTDAHKDLKAPEITNLAGETRTKRRGTGPAVYINYTAAEQALAHQLASDLGKTGISAWMDVLSAQPDVAWASGIRPGLAECTHMIVIMSSQSLEDDLAKESWVAFKGLRKPILIAQVDACEMPDELRRSPRFDFGEDYKSAFRQLMHALTT